MTSLNRRKASSIEVGSLCFVESAFLKYSLPNTSYNQRRLRTSAGKAGESKGTFYGQE